MSDRQLKARLDVFRQSQANASEVLKEGAAKRAAAQARIAARNKKGSSKSAATTPAPDAAASASAAQPPPQLTEGQKFALQKHRVRAAVAPTRKPTSSSILKKVKDVLEYLKSCDEPVSAQNIKENVKDLDGSGVDVPGTPGLTQALTNSGRVTVEGGLFRFQAQFQVHNSKELLALTRNYPAGLQVEDLKDCYRGVEADLDALCAAGSVYRVYSWDLQAEVVFGCDRKSVEALPRPVDPTLAQLFREVQVPNTPQALEDALKEAGIPAAVRSAARRAAMFASDGVEKKRKKQYRQRVYTNVHMPELFNRDQPDTID